jgi:hypothetical protein
LDEKLNDIINMYSLFVNENTIETYPPSPLPSFLRPQPELNKNNKTHYYLPQAEQKSSLVVQIAADKAEMDQLEQTILKMLAESKGDILADESLIITLKKSAETGAGVKIRMDAAEIAMATIEQVTEELRPCATRVS